MGHLFFWDSPIDWRCSFFDPHCHHLQYLDNGASPMKSLKRITRYMRPYKWIIIIGIFTVVLPVAMELVVPRMLRAVIDEGIYAANMEAIVRGSLAMLLAATIGAIATLGQGVCRAQLSQGLAFDLRNALYSHIHSLSFADLDVMQTGQLMTRISSDVDVVRMFTSAGLSLILRALLMIVGSVIMMLLIDWQLSLLMFVFLAIGASGDLGLHAYSPTSLRQSYNRSYRNSTQSYRKILPVSRWSRHSCANDTRSGVFTSTTTPTCKRTSGSDAFWRWFCPSS